MKLRSRLCDAELEALDLSNGGFRQLIDEFDPARIFERRKAQYYGGDLPRVLIQSLTARLKLNTEMSCGARRQSSGKLWAGDLAVLCDNSPITESPAYAGDDTVIPSRVP